MADLVLNNTGEVETLLEDGCDAIHIEKTLCKLAADEIVKLLMKENATELCEKIKLCNKPSLPLLGADLCTRGPGYWCASLGNAKECGALDFCQKKYWV